MRDVADGRLADAWQTLRSVLDPELPVISIVDLGIVRDVRFSDGICEVSVTPTYSGCPAVTVIHDAIIDAFRTVGVAARVVTCLAPAWSTDWISPLGRSQLLAHGVTPPGRRADVIDLSALRGVRERVGCPRCRSTDTRLVSQFGSTACKALYRCVACREPFDYMKPY